MVAEVAYPDPVAGLCEAGASPNSLGLREAGYRMLRS